MGTIPEATAGHGDEKNPLLTPFQLGSFKLAHRSYNTIPQPGHASLYYSQRATPGGLLIAEATGVSACCDGYPHTPGVWTQEQVEAWKPIVKAVHDKGAYFFLQIWHVGRASHVDYQPNKQKPVSSTNKKIETGFVVLPTGFDGVEIHGNDGFLIDQFLKDGVNDRTDQYGGSLENRARFALEIVDAVVAEVGAARVGIRLSPFSEFKDSVDSDPIALGRYLAEELSKRDILYGNWVGPIALDDTEPSTGEVYIDRPFREIRKIFKGAFPSAGGHTRASGIKAIEDGDADAIVYGRDFLANPDLVKRFELNAPLNKYDRSTFYIQDPVVGYTDYPFLEDGLRDLELAV